MPIHCLCDAYLGYTNPCYKVALQSVIIANTLNWKIRIIQLLPIIRHSNAEIFRYLASSRGGGGGG